MQQATLKDPANLEVGDEEERTLLLVNNEETSPWVSSNESSTLFSPAELNASLPLMKSSQLPSPTPTLSALKRRIYNASGLSESVEMKTISLSSTEMDMQNALHDDKEIRRNDKDEDLYSWMARQQKGTIKADHVNEMRDRYIETSDLAVQQPNLLVDTRYIFAPLFASVRLDDKEGAVCELLSLNGSASVLGGVEELRVEIFESEWSSSSSAAAATSKRNKRTTVRSKSGSKFNVYIPPEVPAFLCERMAIEIQVKQVSDSRLRYPPKGVPGFAAFWKPQRTTALNFSLSVGYIAQQVCS